MSAAMPALSSSTSRKAGGLLGEILAVGAALSDPLLDLLILAWMQRREGEVLELPLEVVDAEPMGERRVDLERLLRFLDLLLLTKVAERVHVVQTVTELDQDDADVRRHGDDHLAVVLGLFFLLRVEVHLGELGDPVNEHGDLLAELLLDPLQRRTRILHDVVHERRGDGHRVELELGGVERRAQRMMDIGLAALAALPAM